MSPLFLHEHPMSKCNIPVVDLLPHEPPMVLLDSVVDSGDDFAAAEVTVQSDKPFFVEGKGIQSYVGIEYMAQTCGVFAGLQCKAMGKPVALGFLLGTRNFHANVGWFKIGQRLIITIKENFRHEAMAVFDCRIECEGQELATARLNLYQSEEVGTE